MTYLEILLIAISLSFDTLAVTISSSVTLKEVKISKIFVIALAFGLFQALFLALGWLGGASVMSLIYKIASWMGFGLLLFIGGSMILEVLKGDGEKARDLNSFKAVIIAGIATSIDALAIGVSYALTNISTNNLILSIITTFIITVAVAMTGILGGCKIGCRFGKPAQIIGGIVLILIGVNIII